MTALSLFYGFDFDDLEIFNYTFFATYDCIIISIVKKKQCDI